MISDIRHPSHSVTGLGSDDESNGTHELLLPGDHGNLFSRCNDDEEHENETDSEHIISSDSDDGDSEVHSCFYKNYITQT